MDIKAKALCIKVENYKEKDKLLTLISDKLGKITAIAKSCTAPNSKLKLAASPLSFGEYILIKGAFGRYIVAGCSLEDNFFQSWSDIDRQASCQIVLEILDKISYFKQNLEKELVIALRSLCAINYNDVYPYIYPLWFIARLLPDLGIDISIIRMPKAFKLLFISMENMDTDNLDGLELSLKDVETAYNYIETILKSALSESINSIELALGFMLQCK